MIQVCAAPKGTVYHSYPVGLGLDIDFGHFLYEEDLVFALQSRECFSSLSITPSTKAPQKLCLGQL